MKKSGSITISGYGYEYRTVPKLAGEDGRSLDGWYKVNSNELLFDSGMTPARRKVVFLHEIVHGILEHAGMGEMEHEAQERICNAIAYGLLSVSVDGKKLIK